MAAKERDRPQGRVDGCFDCGWEWMGRPRKWDREFFTEANGGNEVGIGS